jgi:hypothetical protein
MIKIRILPEFSSFSLPLFCSRNFGKRIILKLKVPIKISEIESFV